MLTWIALVLAAMAALGTPAAVTGGRPLLPATAIAFHPREREVTNWRSEAMGHASIDWRQATTLAAGRDPSAVSRCVRLNNYWCIKRAGWAGEIASDQEDHVAFASAMEGADVAALLLRRYYLDLGRHSAIDIVSRWAPASCSHAPVVRTRSAPRASPADHLAVRGIGHTLRARFLSRGRRGGRLAGRMRGSVVADRTVTLLRAPSIAVGLGERTAAPSMLSVAPGSSLSAGTLAAIGAAPLVRTCTGDATRLRNYAEHVTSGVARTIHDDLKLFAPDGTPTFNLARVMLNMAAVEIGPLGARADLVSMAVARLPARPALANARAPAPPPPH